MTYRSIVLAGIVFIGAITIFGLLFVRSALDWPPDEPRTIRGRLLVDGSGRLTHVDSESVVVAPTVFGFNGRRLLIDRETRILIADKEAGIGDLRLGDKIAVIYEPRPEGFVARWLGINLDREALGLAAQRLELTTAESEAPAAVGESNVSISSQPAQPEPPARRFRTGARQSVTPKVPVEVNSRSQGIAAPPSSASSDREDKDPADVIDWLLRRSRSR